MGILLFSIFRVLPVNSLRWSLNPLNPLDVDYDPDADGWLDRDILDTPAIQESGRIGPFLHFQQISSLERANSLYFTILWNTEMGQGR